MGSDGRRWEDRLGGANLEGGRSALNSRGKQTDKGSIRAAIVNAGRWTTSQTM
jgi:hypothetical protein